VANVLNVFCGLIPADNRLILQIRLLLSFFFSRPRSEDGLPSPVRGGRRWQRRGAAVSALCRRSRSSASSTAASSRTAAACIHRRAIEATPTGIRQNRPMHVVLKPGAAMFVQLGCHGCRRLPSQSRPPTPSYRAASSP
jgi:hypothetical protein